MISFVCNCLNYILFGCNPKIPSQDGSGSQTAVDYPRPWSKTFGTSYSNYKTNLIYKFKKHIEHQSYDYLLPYVPVPQLQLSGISQNRVVHLASTRVQAFPLMALWNQLPEEVKRGPTWRSSGGSARLACFPGLLRVSEWQTSFKGRGGKIQCLLFYFLFQQKMFLIIIVSCLEPKERWDIHVLIK